MHILLIGASGMVGQAALDACRKDDRVQEITALVRKPLGVADHKVREIFCADFSKIETISDQLGKPDACLFCAGVSSIGMSEEDYRRVTYDLTLHVAKVLIKLNPAMRFLYVSGVGTDSSEKGRIMWARVKGATENALRNMKFPSVALFRPGFIQPYDKIRSKVGWFNTVYAISKPIYPLLKIVAGKFVTDTDTLGHAMISAVQPGAKTAIYEPVDINRT